MDWGIATAVAAFVILVIAATKVEHFWQRAESSTRRLWSHQRKSRDLKRSDVRAISSRHVSAFSDRGRIGELFVPSTVRDASRVPLLVNDRSLTIRPIDFRKDTLLSIGNAQRVAYPVDDRMVRATIASGRRLTDDSVLFLDTASDVGSEQGHLTAGVTGYRATATLAHRVTGALYGEGPVTIDREELASFDVAVSSDHLRPMVIGSDAVCVFTDGDRDVMPIHRRSAQTVNAPGAFTVTPAYTYAANCVAGVISEFGVIGYNFLREFLEEFWGDEELVEASARPRAHPDWIFESEPARRLIAEVDAGRVELHCVGVGIDVTHCCLTIALAARFTSPTYLKYVMTAPGSWEDSRATGGRPAIEFPELFGAEIEEMSRSSMKPTTLLAIDGARRLMSA